MDVLIGCSRSFWQAASLLAFDGERHGETKDMGLSSLDLQLLERAVVPQRRLPVRPRLCKSYDYTVRADGKRTALPGTPPLGSSTFERASNTQLTDGSTDVDFYGYFAAQANCLEKFDRISWHDLLVSLWKIRVKLN